MKQPRITLLICTRNGERTLEQALLAIANQNDITRDAFEVLVVDNASSDCTAAIATNTIHRLNLNGQALHEPKVGKVNALLTGIQAAQGEFISVIDDDNFIEPGFIRHTLEIFDKYPDVGVVGSRNHLFTEQPVPSWFKFARSSYACSQPLLSDIEEQQENGLTVAQFAIVAGAGSSFRVQPIRECIERGYKFFNDTQRGKAISVAGEDIELCWLMYCLGYRFAYNPCIQVRHAIDPDRLSLKHFEILCKTCGAGNLGTDPFIFTHKHSGDQLPIQWTWQWQLLSKLKRYFHTMLSSSNNGTTAEERQFRKRAALIHCKGEIERILRERDQYTEHIRQVAAGKWTELRVR